MTRAVKADWASGCRRIRRRMFLADCGMGFTGLALGAMLQRDGIARSGSSTEWSPTDGQPHFAPRAKRVIWLFMQGGVSHLESFDPKPELSKYAGMQINETPHRDVLESPHVENFVSFFPESPHQIKHQLYPMQVGHAKRGEAGVEVTDWWPHLSKCVDDLAIVRSMWTTDNDHAAQLQFHTGRHINQGFFPTIGGWVHYGLGSLNDNLPSFVVLGEGTSSCCGGTGVYSADYLGPEHSGIPLLADGPNPLPFGQPGPDVYREEQENEFRLLQHLHQLAQVEYPEDRELRARIQSYELAFRMQSSVPEAFEFAEEGEGTRKLYGLDQDHTRDFGELCLRARRLVERGVRFVQVFHGAGGAGQWDAHSDLKKNHTKLCAQVDQPIAGLIKDLKQRGLLEDTVVVWGTEFGRSPGVEGERGGRDHHPYAFSIWMAGGGIQGGIVHGATDELGFHAVEDRHYVTDIHATVLHQLGLDPRRLQVPGHKRLELDFGKPIQQILA